MSSRVTQIRFFKLTILVSVFTSLVTIYACGFCELSFLTIRQTLPNFWSPYSLQNDDKMADLDPEVVLALVVCGQKRKVALNAMILVKSAILFSKGVRLKIIIFRDNATDAGQKFPLEFKLQQYAQVASEIGRQFDFEILNASFPKEDSVDWRNMYMPCTTQRLFLPSLLPDTDAVIYLDADTIFVSRLKDMWSIFGDMDSYQLMGMIGEHEPPSNGYYNLKSKIPYYGPRGLNGGVALMNLTRMRTIKFQQIISQVEQQYKNKIVYADQDLMNIVFAKNPHLMYNVSCAYNFRKDHCLCFWDRRLNCSCKDAEENGAALVHGNIRGFDFLPLKAIHWHFKNFHLATENATQLYDKIYNELNGTATTPNNLCLHDGVKGKLLTRFKNYLNEL